MPLLRLLGGYAVETEGRPLTGRAAQRKRLALLPLLATAAGRRLSRDKLTALLWPESDSEHARHQLASTVHELRRALGRDAILSVGDDLQLNPEVMGSDLDAFEEACRAQAWERAVALYRGPFLDGFYLDAAPAFERWMERERARLADQHARALEALAAAAERTGDLDGAVEWRRRLAIQDPYDSRIALGLARALVAAGSPAGGLQHARVHAALLSADLGIGPPREVEELIQRLSADGSRSQTPAVVAPRPSERRDRVVRESRWRRADGARSRSHWHAAPGARQRAVALIAGLLLLVLSGVARHHWSRAREAQSPGGRPRVVAVLPFATQSPAPADAYLGDGVAAEITTELARMPPLQVIAWSSVVRYRGPGPDPRDVARELGADALVEGSVFRTGDELRIDVRLIDGLTAHSLWAESYSGHVREALAVHRRIALDVAGGIRLALTPAARRLPPPRPVDPDAFDAYLRGRHELDRGVTLRPKEALPHLQRAIALDSSFAPAYAALAFAHAHTGYAGLLPDTSAYRRAQAAAERALALDSTLTEAHVSLALVALNLRRDWETSERILRHAIWLDPSSVRAHNHVANLLLLRGRFDEAIAAKQRAVALDPGSLILTAELAWSYYIARRPEEALLLCERILRRDPGNAGAHAVMGLVHRFQGRYDEALTQLHLAGRLSGRGPINRATIAQVLASAGREREARSALRELLDAPPERRPSSYHLAAIHALLGDREEALSLLEAAHIGDGWLPRLNVDPVFDGLRGEPRFRALIRRLGLGTPSEAGPGDDPAP